MGETHTKYNCFAREIEIYKIASSHGIAPKIIDIEGLSITTEKHTCLVEIDDPARYVHQIEELVRRLHEIGILWNDPFIGNVVVDKKCDRAYLIDFGASCMIETIGNDPRLKETFKDIIDQYLDYDRTTLTQDMLKTKDKAKENDLMWKLWEDILDIVIESDKCN